MSPQRGNILFLILLAVVLFAALAYAVTSSLRGGGKDAVNEGSLAAATQLINYAASYENAVMRMAMNIPYQNIQYWKGANSGCPDATCRVLSPTGGGVSDIPLEKKYMLNPDVASGGATGNQWQVRLIKVENVGTSKPEIAIVFYGLKKEICLAINQILNVPSASITTVPSGITITNSSATHEFGQSHTPPDVTAETTYFRYANVGITGASIETAGRSSFCICEGVNCTSSNEGFRYSFWHVIMPQ